MDQRNRTRRGFVCENHHHHHQLRIAQQGQRLQPPSELTVTAAWRVCKIWYHNEDVPSLLLPKKKPVVHGPIETAGERDHP